MYGTAFLTYQAEVVQAVEANGNSSGVAIPTISGSGGTPLPGAGNQVVQNGSTVTIAVYAALSSGQMAAAIVQSGGNATIGWSRNGQWVSPIYGQMGGTPLGVPDGDAVSFVALERH
ncbi:hypothetical protein AA105894_1676 [Asaia spathodeae NBRC 105894]|nr:hypothetical protein AA105894_1676 [Asaia spathodeae NBRC 105894]